MSDHCDAELTERLLTEAELLGHNTIPTQRGGDYFQRLKWVATVVAFILALTLAAGVIWWVAIGSRS